MVLKLNRAYILLFFLGFITALLLFATTVLVRASIPNQNGVINACYRTNGGDLRVRDDSNPIDTCSNKETPISWNQGSTSLQSNTAVAHISVDQNTNLPTIDSVSSRGIVDIAESTVSPGLYCITLDIDPKVAVYNSTSSVVFDLKTDGVWRNYGIGYQNECDTYPLANVALNIATDTFIIFSE